MLAISLLATSSAVYADPPGSQAFGTVADPSAIFELGRGELLDKDSNPDHQITELTSAAATTESPRANAPAPANASIDSSAPKTFSLPIEAPQQISQAISEPQPLARGNLSEPAAAPLTDNLARNLAFTLGSVALSATLDRSGDAFAKDHGQNSTVKAITNVGDALPFIAIGAAALAALDTNDQRLSMTGISALQAGGASALSSFGLKYLVARARPEADLGPTAFHNAATSKGDSSFPSIHTATLWGIVTPFAKEYDMPWLYGVALLTNFSRVAGRKHWVSDTVAGSLIGYWAGDLAWHRNKPRSETSAQVYLGERSVTVAWPF